MNEARRTSRAVGPCLVWLLSALPFLVEPFLLPGRFAGVSRAALAALPWLAWAGLPRNAPAELRAAVFDLALCIPPIALASWIDLASGIPRSDVVLVAVVSAVLVLALSLAARMSSRMSLRARMSPRARNTFRAYAIVWLACVAGAPLLRCALELGGAPLFGPAPAWLSWTSRASPIGWIVARLDPSDTARPLGAVLLVLVLLTIGALGVRAAEREGESP